MSEWVSELNILLSESRQQGPCYPEKLYKNNIYIGIIISLHIDNTHFTGYNLFEKITRKETQKSERTHWVDIVIGDANSTSVYNNTNP